MRVETPAAAVLSLAFALGCSRADADLREWRPSDHQHTSEGPSENGQEGPQVSGSAEPLMPGLDEVTIAAWRRACTSCHGQIGRGDGPQGPMVRARDLSDPAWQASVSDAQVAESITKGRGKMPGFALPEATVQGLVHLVRLFDRDRLARAEASARAARIGAPPAPSGSALPEGHGAAPRPAGSR